MKNKYSKIISFENHKLGLYDVKTFVKDWGSKPRRGIKEKRCKIIKQNKNKILQITIPKGTLSDGGSFWRLKFPRDLDDVTFEYEIMFGKNFNFVRGGKLPGLGGGTSAGCKGTPEEHKNGFSARLMWREINFEKTLLLKKPLGVENKKLKELIKSGASQKEILNQLNNIGNEVIKYEWHLQDLVKQLHKAFLVQYLYYPDKGGRFGENEIYRHKNKKLFIEPNKWYTIKNRIKLSENPKEKDTVIAWVNGKKVMERKVDLRKKKSYGINQVMFSLFFGGEDETWATTKKEKVYFRRFVFQEN